MSGDRRATAKIVDGQYSIIPDPDHQTTGIVSCGVNGGFRLIADIEALT